MTDALPPPSAARCWTLDDGSGPVDVEVHATEGTTLGRVRAALAAAGLPAGPLWSGADPLADSLPLHDPRLRHGARLGSDRPGLRQPGDGGALELQVCAGPGAGRRHALAHGRSTVGRGPTDGTHAPGHLPLPDPGVSRTHLEVAVDGPSVTVRDPGSANGTRWLVAGSVGDPVGDQPQPWPLGAVLRLGSTSLRLTAPTGPTRALRPAPGGRLQLEGLRAGATPADEACTDAPGGRTAVGEVVVAVPDDPPDPPRRPPAWVAVLLPALAGGALAVVLGSPHFLLVALLGPLVALGTWVSDRWSGRRGHRRRRAEHELALAEVAEQVSAAVGAETAQRERAAPDPAVLTGAAHRRTAPLWGAAATTTTVRLGSGPGSTRVVRGAGPPLAVDLHPVTLDLAGPAGGGPDLVVRGPRDAVLGVLRSVLCQLVTLHPPGRWALTVLAPPGTLDAWAWTRWLPHCVVAPAPGAGPVPRHVVVLDGEPHGPARSWLHRARAEGAVVVTTRLEGAAGAAVLDVVGETGAHGRLAVPGLPTRTVELDLVDRDVAEQLAVDLAPLTAPGGPAGLPERVRWRDLVAGRATTWSRSRRRLTTVLGVGVDGPVELDLCAVGPHVLVAGTTGAGKSELLRTLVLGLARAHPPDRCSFLLVDYKGGAAFADCADLPHTVGVLTDLDGAATARALQSLVAELTRRERLLADHGARDLADLPDPVLLPRLVIVVDEFATLGDELPGFVPGLVGIAQRGRSLGVHLVLATQRPSGSVGPEIRANCTVRLCLRTTDETGSLDVIGVPDAARLPVDRPGRALLRVGAGAPALLQVARVGEAAPQLTTDRTPVLVRRRTWPASPDVPAAPGAGDGDTDLSLEVARLRHLAAPLPAPPRPWSPPLPDRVAPAPAADRDPPAVLRWGLVDHPGRQSQDPLLVDLAAGGGWLVVGGPGSGRTTALHTLLAAATTRLHPDQLHVHVVDHAGGALVGLAQGLPHTGTAVARGDGHRLHRLLVRLQHEVDRRRSAPGPHPHLLVLVDGLDAVADAAEEVLPGVGAATLLRVLREGAAVGLTAVLTADRVLPGSRLAGAAGHRVVLPLPDRADYPLAGVPVALVPGHRPPGRGLLGPDALQVQLALPGPLPGSARTTVPGRVEVVELPADPPPCAPGPPGQVALGPGGDDGTPVLLDIQRCGGLLVAGPPGSGRSCTLAALAARLTEAGTPVLQVAPGAPTAAVLERLDAWGPEGGVVLADDLGRLPDPVLDALASVTGPGAPAALVAAASTADVASAFRGPGPALRRNRTALLLQPARGDAELLGMRLPRDPLPTRPGAGWLVTPGGVVRVQVSRRR